MIKGYHQGRKESVDMRKTVAKVIHQGTYRVVHDSEKHINPYTIYYESYDIDGDFHARKVESYADLAGCLYHIAEVIIR